MRLRALLGFALTAAILTAPGEAGAVVVKRAVSFQVRNVNRSSLPCPSDGAPYVVRGHLVGPASKVGPGATAGHRAATLYLHGFSLGESFWSFGAVPRNDYAAALARGGHASIVIDRLGYGSSGHPEGDQTCLGAAADVAHQVIGDLRSGDYDVGGGEPPRFESVALAGHSVGALIANVEAFSFHDVDGLVAIGYTPQVTPAAFEQFYASRVVCGTGGQLLQPGGPGGYAYIGQTEAEFERTAFHSVAPDVRALTAGLRARDPCGDSASLVDALVQDLKSLSRVTAPVLVVCGREDAVTPSFACPVLKRRYAGSNDVSLAFVPKAGHALTLERTAPAFRRRVEKWLSAHGL
jgi:pimeloyl-ACP methyl ester carboxylesterase